MRPVNVKLFAPTLLGRRNEPTRRERVHFFRRAFLRVRLTQRALTLRPVVSRRTMKVAVAASVSVKVTFVPRVARAMLAPLARGRMSLDESASVVTLGATVSGDGVPVPVGGVPGGGAETPVIRAI